MNIKDFIKQNTFYLDGGMGTMLQERGLDAGEYPELWNLTHAEDIVAIHRAYFEAGSNMVNANTFGANSLKFSSDVLESVIGAAMEHARNAKVTSGGNHPKWIALDIGPTGCMLKPYGDLDFEDAVRVFAETVRLGVKYGADAIFIETMNDSYETKAALLAAKENCDLPVFVSNAYAEGGKLMTGASPAAMVAMLEGLGADVIGVNCSFGPRALADVVEEYLRCASVPVLFKPNAGLPHVVGGKTIYDVASEEFAADVTALVAKGVRAVGGCCGTTPAYISALVKDSADITAVPLTEKQISCVSSYTHAVTFAHPVLIGERINPTGKKQFKQALREGNIDYLLKEGIDQQEKGVHILDVNVGLPDIDEAAMLTCAVNELQAVVDLPLQIDTSDPIAMERALRRYNGKAMINSVSGKRESMDAVFPLAKKYGGLIVALTLDERGIPATAEERVGIAENILAEAKKYGLSVKDLIFDPLALTISADARAGRETLRAVRMIHEQLGAHTLLGVSNVSFGLPERDIINSTYFALALGAGLSAAIMNPYSEAMMKTWHAYAALSGMDDNCGDYIAFAEALPKTVSVSVTAASVNETCTTPTTADDRSALQHAIVKGLRERAAALTESALAVTDPLDIVQREIIPALDIVGVGFENKTLYLPQLLMSAEAAGASFEVIKAHMPVDKTADRCAVVIATVKGDIHDIGKNIVKLLLENYGFAVTDLGRDVPPEAVVEAAVRLHAPLVGLSALMTTTVPAMEETIRALRVAAPWCRVVVGGAVLTQEYADAIGADHYAKDAMGAVRYAEQVEREVTGA